MLRELDGLRSQQVARVGRGIFAIEPLPLDDPRGLVIIMAEQYSRRHLVDLLNRLGHVQLAEEASRALPEVVDADWLAEWLIQHGLTHDYMISQMGGSP